jgi:hypothetical protein
MGAAVALLFAGTGRSQNNATEVAGSVIQYCQKQWNVVKVMTADFGASLRSARVVLLKSVAATGTDGLGESMNDVALLILQGRATVYEYSGTPRFFFDDKLEITDVTGDGIRKSYSIRGRAELRIVRGRSIFCVTSLHRTALSMRRLRPSTNPERMDFAGLALAVCQWW